MISRSLGVRVGVGVLLIGLTTVAADAQQAAKPRVLLMVDTSGSMTEHMIDTGDTLADQSVSYVDGVIGARTAVPGNTEYSLYPGNATANACTASPTYDPNTSRMFNAKQAVTNVINGSGDIDWGLMRYAGSYCSIVNTSTPNTSVPTIYNTGTWPNANGIATCTKNSDCSSNRCNTTIGRCTCTNSSQCGGGTCNTNTGECLCTANNQCASNSCNTNNGQCNPSVVTQCSSGSWNPTTKQCTCTANNQCPSNSCNIATGQCNCSNDNQCLGGLGGFGGNFGGTCTGGQCLCTANSACGSGDCDGNRAACGCTANNQCPSNSCNTTTGECQCTAGAQCQSGTCNTTGTNAGKCACTNDFQCAHDEFCAGGICVLDNNLCNNAQYGGSSTRGAVNGTGTCSLQKDLPTSYAGACGTGVAANSAPCNTKQVCYSNSDCSGGTCALDTSGLWGTCSCSGGAQCPADYSCTGGKCVYNQSCIGTTGGVILVDPVAGQSSSVLPWVDGVEDFETIAGPAPNIKNPELRAVGNTPLAGAARQATSWYNTAIAGDTQKTCRPYVLVQITDGFDTCETGDQTVGPAAAAGGFVAATTPGAKNPNKVYVIGLAFGSTPNTVLDAIAAAGGTGQARLANSEADIESALADIVASSVLVEKCNGADDNCNGACDENFPGVAVTNPGSDGKSCNNVHAASTCDNGAQAGTHCVNSGHFVCTADQQGQTCSSVSCAATITGTLSSGGAGVMRITNAVNIPPTAIGQLIYVNGSAKAADNGVFPIVAINSGANTVDVTNAAFAADATVVAWGYTSLQGVPTSITIPSNTTERITVPKGLDPTVGANNGVIVGDTVYVTGAAPAALNGAFMVKAVTSTGAGPYTIDLVNAAATLGTTVTKVGQWLDAHYCPQVEICDGIDNDCNGIIDDCPSGGASGSCCPTPTCPACAKPPFVETCNGCDDDCNGIIDDGPASNGGKPIDTGISCGTSVGDCLPGVTICCSNTGATAGNCTTHNVGDVISCAGGNPGYPVTGADLCDGTDDNCNGVVNDTPAQACFTAPGGGMLTGSPNCNGMVPANQCACHAGVQQCVQPADPAPGAAGTCAGPPPIPPNPATISWPPTLACPNYNPATKWGACSGALGGSAEICNNIDDDCDGVIDNGISDPWANPGDPSHVCCTPGGNCNNTGGGTRCEFGGYACVSGVKTCVGAIPQSPEICDGIDNDCNGIIDDVPGLGTNCTGNGVILGGACQATLQCVSGNPVPQCVQTVGPVPEMCNGIDDDCDGVIDNPPFVPTPGMPVVGTQCDVPVAPADKPPCMAGTNQCVAGMIVCEGAVGPMPNQCNGISTDCTGTPNTNGNCPTGFECYQGNCVSPCSAGEFPCEGGYACNMGTNACDLPGLGHVGCCVPDACAKINCPTGDVCQLDAQGNGQCIDPCVSVNCGAGYICKLGTCEDASCRTQGCPTGQLCTGTPPSCTPDPCVNVTCVGDQFCDNGKCVAACAGPCPAGENCVDGKCVGDPCAKIDCLENQVCVITNGVGTCVANQCVSGCNPGDVCCGGSCLTDPCVGLHCPEDTHCTVLSTCTATCNTNPAPPRDQIVGAGGGGFGCSIGGERDSAPSLGLVFAGLLLILWRRRRGGAGAAGVR